jgi:hypothetical protein
MRELRPFAGLEVRPSPWHRERQDVGEQDRRVERETIERLQRHFGRVVGILREAEETAGAARRVVFGQIAAGLAHQPDRRVVGRLAQKRTQEGVVEQGMGHGRSDDARANRHFTGARPRGRHADAMAAI